MDNAPARITRRKNPLDDFTPEVPPAVSEATERRRGVAARPGLSPREARFVTGYLHHGNPVKAMSEAGYEIASKTLADMLLDREDIAKVIDEQVDAITALSRVTHARIIAEHANIAFADPADLVPAVDGSADIDDLPPHVRAAIRKVKVRRKGDSVEVEYDLYDKQRSLDALGKITGLNTDSADEEAATSFSKLLAAALKKLDGG